MNHSKKSSYPSASHTLRGNPIYFCTPTQAYTLLTEGRDLLLFVRHGLTDWNTQMRLQGREEVPLNDVGREQARELANLIGKAGRISDIFTSPLSRAKDTASIISSELRLDEPVVLDTLIERDYSLLSGLTMAERRQRFPTPKDYPADIESTVSAAHRMKKVALKLFMRENKENGITVAVTHGGVINSLFSYLTRGRAGTGKNVAKNCSISAVASGESDIIPLAFNLLCTDFVDYVNSIRENESN